MCAQETRRIQRDDRIRDPAAQLSETQLPGCECLDMKIQVLVPARP